MKLSFDWLSDFVDLSGLSAHEVAERLTMGAFEVEEVTSFGADIVGPLVVGEILEINPHPNADKIRLTKIRLSEGAQAQEIVCGAWNIEVGHKIPVALPGARVVNRHDGTPLLIKENKIRGVVSNGMLCSAPELGIAGSDEGIMILSPDTKIGIDAKELLGIRNDYVLHVEPRSNRGDALCVLGLAREVAALFGRPLKEQAWVAEFAAMQEDAQLASLALEIDDINDCPYFTVRVLAGLQVGTVDPLISRRLETVGVKSINNVVDITNYVLHELGQPLHAYDLLQIKGNKLCARRAKAHESLTTIDGKERKLNEDALIIADAESVVGVAGVMGGKFSEVSDNTTTIALEAASFASARVRRSSRTLGLSSESSLRFERGVDTAQVSQSSNRASYLMAKYAGARLGKMTEAGSSKVPQSLVSLRMSELKRFCEIEMKADEAGKLLQPLGFERQDLAGSQQSDSISFAVPSFRQKDVYREIDLIEELTRLYGYEKMPVSMPASTVAARVIDPLPQKVRQAMRASGLSEAWLSSLTSQEDLDGRKSFDKQTENEVCVQNPLSAEHQVLRQSLLPGLIKAVSYNQDRGNAVPCLFEIGKVYRHEPRRFNKQVPAHKQTSTLEENMVAAVVCGEPRLSLWNDSAGLSTSSSSSAGKQNADDAKTYYLIKGMLENLALSFNIPLSALSYEKTDRIPGWFHPGRSAACFVQHEYAAPKAADNSAQASDNNGNKKAKSGKPKPPVLLAYLGEIHPLISDAYRLSGRAAALELSLQALAEASAPPTYFEVYMTPAIQRDLTCDLDYSVSHQEVEYCLRAAADATMQSVVLVSIFRLSESKKSLSYRLTFQDPKQTLTSDAVDAVMQRVRGELGDKLGASFRL